MLTLTTSRFKSERRILSNFASHTFKGKLQDGNAEGLR